MNTQVKAIRDEVERMLTFDGSVSTSYYIGKRDAEREIKAFIDSLPDKPKESHFLKAVKEIIDDMEKQEEVNLPEWKKLSTKVENGFYYSLDEAVLVWDGYEITLSDLLKLPKKKD